MRVQKYRNKLSPRHTYSFNPNSNTPYHFRFSVSSDVFRDPESFGRPAGVFNADCWGTTPQDPNETRTAIKRSEDPNTAARFPLATCFSTRAAAALECDFWKLVLRKKYFLEIPWSHESLEAYLEASQLAQEEYPLNRLEDESTWSHELLDFINEHLSELHKHREAHKPEVDLDEWARVARKEEDHALRAWVEAAREAQSDLEKHSARFSERLLNQLRQLEKKLSAVCELDRPYPTQRDRFLDRVGALSVKVGSVSPLHQESLTLLTEIEEQGRALKLALERALKSRPPVTYKPKTPPTP